MTRSNQYNGPKNSYQQSHPRQEFHLEEDQLDTRSYPVARRIHRNNTPPQQTESESGNSQQRRRIQVACARCRKRKIRCSGDRGDGLGCDTCKSIGANALPCTFVRVLSYPLGLGVRTSNEDLRQPAESSPTSNGMTGNFPQRFIPNSNWVNEPDTQAPEYNGYSPHSRAAPANQIPIRSAGILAADSVGYNNPGLGGYAGQAQCCSNPSHGSYPNISSSNMSNYAAPQAPYCSTSDPRNMNTTSHGLPPFGMTPLYTSLPTHATSDRQLPIPSTGRLPIAHSGLLGSISSQGSSYRGSFSWTNDASSQRSEQTNPRYGQSTMSGLEFRKPYSPNEQLSPLGYSTYRTEASPTSAVSTSYSNTDYPPSSYGQYDTGSGNNRFPIFNSNTSPPNYILPAVTGTPTHGLPADLRRDSAYNTNYSFRTDPTRESMSMYHPSPHAGNTLVSGRPYLPLPHSGQGHSQVQAFEGVPEEYEQGYDHGRRSSIDAGRRPRGARY